MSKKTAMQDLELVLNYVDVASPLIVALQQEWYYTRLYIGPGADGDPRGKEFKSSLLDRRRVAQAAEKLYVSFLDDNQQTLGSFPTLAGDLEQIKDSLSRFKYVRMAADERVRGSTRHQAEFGEKVWTMPDMERLIAKLIKSLTHIVVLASEDQKLSLMSNAFYNLIEASYANALLNGFIDTSYTGNYSSAWAFGMMKIFESKERAYQQMFLSFADDHGKQVFNDQLINTSDYRQALKAYNFAVESHKDLSVGIPLDGIDWRSTSANVFAAYQRTAEAVLAELIATKNERVADAQSMLYQTIALVIVLVIGIVAVSIWIAGSITNPLKKLVLSFNLLADNKDMSIRLNDSGSDELAELSRAFNSLVTSFNDALVRVKGHADEMNTTTHDVAEAMAESLQLSARQREATDSVSVAVNEMTATIQEVSSMAQMTSQAVNTAHDTSVSSAQSADVSRTMMENLTVELGNTSDVVNNLNDEATQISSILNVIQGIAEQTNLLALNAAIEAARAGEMGRGFAVVADEVRSLAGRTQESTEQIRQQIETLLHGAEAATSNMASLQAEGSRAVEAVIETTSAFNAIKSELDSIMQMATQIATATEEQTSVSNEINQRITAISDDSADLASQATKTVTATESLTTNGDDLQRCVALFELESTRA
ncbi:methyl-accepting chemotaxis protein [Neiella marina]|nr:methyl-accepting chemotaxis protein [Neiella marina]